jgi:hypothetical protein
MNKTLPNKWVRKAVYDLVNNITVNGNTIPCFDTRVTTNKIPSHYILTTTQSNTVDKNNKCESFWDSDILIDIITTYNGKGNPGSRLLSDDILDSVRNLTKDIQLDISSGLEIITRTQNVNGNVSTITDNQNVFRNLLRLTLVIK